MAVIEQLTVSPTVSPIVSVVIPIFNRMELLERSLGSVLAQTESNIEVWVVDDHSHVLLDDAVAQWNDSRIHLLRLEKNAGVSGARNAGIVQSKAPWVALLDSDDQWVSTKLEKQIAFAAEHEQFRMVHSEELWIRNGKRVNPPKHYRKSGGDIFSPSLQRCIISPSTVLMRRELFDEYGLFDTALPVCEDYDMWLRILSNEEVGFIDEPLISKFGGHDDQLSMSYPAMDRYRIQSMIKLLDSSRLSVARTQEIQRVIGHKAKILLQGATKRQLPEAALYREWVERFGSC